MEINDSNSNEEIIVEREKQAKFINETVMNEQMINEYYKFYKRKIKKFDFISFLICGAILIIMAIYNLFTCNNDFLGVIFNVITNIILIAIGIIFWHTCLKNEKYDKQMMIHIYDEDISKIKTRYYFNEDTLIIINKYGETERLYDCLESVYETKEYYYICVSKNNTYILKKDSFIKGEERDFNVFIRQELGKGYKK